MAEITGPSGMAGSKAKGRFRLFLNFQANGNKKKYRGWTRQIIDEWGGENYVNLFRRKNFPATTSAWSIGDSFGPNWFPPRQRIGLPWQQDQQDPLPNNSALSKIPMLKWAKDHLPYLQRGTSKFRPIVILSAQFERRMTQKNAVRRHKWIPK